MKVLSLFDGMSCGRIALKELGIIPEKYYASEIDKYAIKQTQLNFPDTIQLGSVTEWRTWNIDWKEINLILAGSPCQGFSFAGKQLAFDDPRSKLFFEFAGILNHCKKFNPDVKFLLENVDMKKDHLRIISEYVGVFPENINSNLVSAQNRSRWYWSNIRTKNVGLFDEVYTDIPQPKDEGILLKDILEDEVDEKYFISEAVLNRISHPKINPEKSYACVANNNTGSFGNPRSATLIINIDGNPKPNQDKASCFTAGAHSGSNHS
jgi:DNA (cytosine-5)-methyltransferase 3A